MKVDLVGEEFGRLTVVREGRARGAGRSRRRRWECSCSCGGEALVSTSHLRSGHTRSCGCLSEEARSQFKHGHSKAGSAEYVAWMCMRQRCSDPRDSRYGGRGIRVCDRWSDFSAFLDDMGRKPTPEHSIDRIDNDGNYEPGNCRWATRVQQARNNRRTRRVRIGDVEMSLAEWCDVVGAPWGRAHKRLQMGWDPVDALMRPARSRVPFTDRSALLAHTRGWRAR